MLLKKRRVARDVRHCVTICNRLWRSGSRCKRVSCCMVQFVPNGALYRTQEWLNFNVPQPGAPGAGLGWTYYFKNNYRCATEMVVLEWGEYLPTHIYPLSNPTLLHKDGITVWYYFRLSYSGLLQYWTCIIMQIEYDYSSMMSAWNESSCTRVQSLCLASWAS